jgi:hypothetical protein
LEGEAIEIMRERERVVGTIDIYVCVGWIIV